MTKQRDNFGRTVLDALYRLDFGAFAYAAFAALYGKPLVANWHIDHICYLLQQMAGGKADGRLVINLPPRSLKSSIVSVFWVAWLLGHDPTKKILCASYSEDLAFKFSRDCRTLIETDFYKRIFPRTRVSRRKATEGEFETTRGGYRLATSVGGTLTGRGGDVLIVDDPIKANDAGSRTALVGANEWFQNTAISRLDDPSKSLIVVTMQRLHQGDLSGTLIDSGWPSVVIPAIAVEPADHLVGKGKFYHRPVGQQLQPDRDSIEPLEAIKRQVGSTIFAAQYQQNPTPAEGNMIKAAWLQRYAQPPDSKSLRQIVLACDPAGKAGPRNDYTAMTVWGVGKTDAYLLDATRGRWTVSQMRERVLFLASSWTPSRVLIEDTASGMGLIQWLKEEPALNIVGRRSKDDKETRMARHQGRFEALRIVLPKSLTQNSICIDALLRGGGR